MRNIEKTEQTEKPYLPNKADNKHTNQIKSYDLIQREIKTEKMSKLRREVELLERGMQSEKQMQ